MAEAPTTLTVRIKCDEDWLRLTAYREALREIAKQPVEPWDGEYPYIELARKVLETMGEELEP